MLWILRLMKKLGINGAGGTIKQEKLPLLKAIGQTFKTTTYLAKGQFVCFTLSFTDSYRNLNGTVWYGLATTNGF